MSGSASLFAKLLATLQLMSGGGTPPQAYTVGGSITGLDEGSLLVIALNEAQLEITGNGSFVFPNALNDLTSYEVDTISEPPRVDCDINANSGTIMGQDVGDVEITCETNDSAQVFALDRLHRVRITMTLEEWRAFELDTIRANYSIRDASGDASPLTSYSHSEVYRQADFTWLNSDGSETRVE